MELSRNIFDVSFKTVNPHGTSRYQVADFICYEMLSPFIYMLRQMPAYHEFMGVFRYVSKDRKNLLQTLDPPDLAKKFRS